MMRKFALIMLLIGIILVSVIAGDETTVWGPGENYKIIFLQSGILKIDNDELKRFENLPVTEFRVANFTNSAFTFNYLGYDNITFNSRVEIIKTDRLNNKSLEYPSGGFPIALPIKYNKHDDWILYFSQQENLTFLDDPYHFSSSRVLIDEDFITFNFQSVIDINFTHKNEIKAFTFMDISDLDSISASNMSFSTTLTYTINTGTLYLMNYTLNSGSNNDEYKIRLSEQMDFVAIIPAIEFLNNVGIEITGVVLALITGITINKKLLDLY